MCATDEESMRVVSSTLHSSFIQTCQVNNFFGRFTALPSAGEWWWCQICEERIPTVTEVVEDTVVVPPECSPDQLITLSKYG